MRDWNVVVTAQPEGYKDALRLLTRYGDVDKTGYFNVLVMKVEDPAAFLEGFAAQVAREPGTLNFISHVSPAERAFDFTDRQDFEAAACGIVCGWAPRLAGGSFHVRMRRRGLRSLLSSHVEERTIDEALLDALARSGAQGRIAFDDPDAVIAVETVERRAGLSLWSREKLRTYPFLGLD